MPPPITLASPLPAADLLFESMTASSALSMLGEVQLGLISPKPDLKPEDLLGKPVTVTVALRDGAKVTSTATSRAFASVRSAAGISGTRRRCKRGCDFSRAHRTALL